MSGEIEEGYAARRRKEVRKAKSEEQKENNPNRKAVLTGMQEGKNNEEILKDITGGIGMLKEIIKDIYASGDMTRAERKKAMELRKSNESGQMDTRHKKTHETQSSTDIDTRGRVIRKMLLLGLQTRAIQTILNISYKEYEEGLEYVKTTYGITDEQIEEARRQRVEEGRTLVCTLKKRGYTSEEIAERLPYSGVSRIKDIIKKLEKDGILTERDLELSKIERKARRFVLRGLKEGLTEEEIASKCQVKELTVEDVKVYIDELIELGAISKDEIILARQNKEANSNKESSKQVEPYEKQIETLYRLGFSGQQITKITKLSDGYVRKIRNKLGITVEQSKEWQSRRKEMANKRKFDISAMVGFSKDIDIKTIQDQIAYLRAEKELHGVRPQDISTIGKVIPMEHSLLTLGNINFVVRCLSDLSKLEEAVSFINECLDAARTYEDTKNNGKLISMRELLERKIARQKEEQAKRGAKTHKSRREAWIASSVKATPQGEIKLPQEGDEAPERADTRSVVDSEIAE